jgi:hypothetical protein
LLGQVFRFDFLLRLGLGALRVPHLLLLGGLRVERWVMDYAHSRGHKKS